MKNKFWIEEKSPKQLYTEFILPENSNASFWDVFKNYEPDYSRVEPADLSKEWLQREEKIIDEIVKNHFVQIQLKQKEIESLIDAIEEYLLPEEDQYTEDLSDKYKELARNIAQRYILPLQLERNTIDNFIDRLEYKLELLNESHIAESNKEAMRQSIRLKGIRGEYSKEKVEEILQNLEMMWSIKTEIDETEYEEVEDETEIEVDDFIYPKYPLAFSTTFYGFNGDAGNLSYEEQEQFAQEKFKEYEDEISSLLNQEPHSELLPKKIDFEDNSTWDKYYELSEGNPFMYEFDGAFSIWKKDNKVLFLSMNKEDKELPYEIAIGGLVLSKYSEILNKYNSITK